jgi:hypothetical protein
MKVIRSAQGMIHRVCFCQEKFCTWNDAYSGVGGRSIEAVARAAKRHTEKTGHSVIVESGTTFTYSAS